MPTDIVTYPHWEIRTEPALIDAVPRHWTGYLRLTDCLAAPRRAA